MSISVPTLDDSIPPSEDRMSAELKRKLNSLFVNPEVAARIVSQVTRNKPASYGKRSVSPYYKHQFGVQMKVSVDSMLTTGHDIVFAYEKFCGPHGMSNDTLYHFVNQSVRYLVEELDTANELYKRWREMVHVRKVPKLGIRISFIPDLVSGTFDHVTGESIQPMMALPVSESPKWMKAMEDWLEGDSPKPFVMEKLALTSDEVLKIKTDLNALKGVMASVDCTCIRIIRVNE